MKTAAEKCAMCGGEFSTQRIHIEGKALHPGCAVMSYPPHTPEDMDKISGEVERLRTALYRAYQWLSTSGMDATASEIEAECAAALGIDATAKGDGQ